jgi:hypothetical protein
MEEGGIPKTILLEEPGGYRNIRCPRLRWLDMTDTLARAGVRNWKRTQDRELWWKITEEAKVHLGLLCC